MDLTSAVAVNANAFFFRCNKVLHRSRDKFASLPERGHPRTEIGHFKFDFFFFFAFLGLEIEMGHSRDIFLSRDFPYEHSEIFSTNFYYALSVFLEQ